MFWCGFSRCHPYFRESPVFFCSLRVCLSSSPMLWPELVGNKDGFHQIKLKLCIFISLHLVFVRYNCQAFLPSWEDLGLRTLQLGPQKILEWNGLVFHWYFIGISIRNRTELVVLWVVFKPLDDGCSSISYMLRHESHVFELWVETKFEVVDSHSLFNPKNNNSCTIYIRTTMIGTKLL